MSLLHASTGSTRVTGSETPSNPGGLVRSSSRNINRGRRTDVSMGFMLLPKKTRAKTKTDPGTGTETMTATVTETEEETEVSQVISAWEIPPHCVRLWSWFMALCRWTGQQPWLQQQSLWARWWQCEEWTLTKGWLVRPHEPRVLVAMSPNHPTTDPKVSHSHRCAQNMPTWSVLALLLHYLFLRLTQVEHWVSFTTGSLSTHSASKSF